MIFLQAGFSFLQIFFLCFILGLGTASLAKVRGRNQTIWFFLGMCFGLVGMLVLYLLPSHKPLKEPAVAVAAPVAAEPSTVVIAEPPAEWFFVDKARQQQGPVQLSHLKSKMADKTIDSLTYVWRAGMDNWKKIKDISEVKFD